MSVHTHACVSVTCDGTAPSGLPCGDSWWEEQDDPGRPHWPTTAAAVESITSSYGWVVTDQGEYCPACAERQLPKPSAAELDRRWQPWPDLFEGGHS